MSKTVILTETQLVGALKKIVNESPEDAPFGWYGDGNREEDEELYRERDKLHQRLWKAIEDTDDKCENCHDMELYPDEECPDCGRKNK